MTPPRPAALRLCTRAAGGRPPRPPLGLASFTGDAPALAVVLEVDRVDDDDARNAGALFDQVPRAADLPPATPVFVFGEARRTSGLFPRLWPRTASVSRATRCTILLGRGYVSVGAGVDAATGADLAWGLSSPC
jgi:hypothetical protein